MSSSIGTPTDGVDVEVDVGEDDVDVDVDVMEDFPDGTTEEGSSLFAAAGAEEQSLQQGPATQPPPSRKPSALLNTSIREKVVPTGCVGKARLKDARGEGNEGTHPRQTLDACCPF